MTVESRTLSAAERRERRLKRILGNSEERMKKILSGPDGDEHRLPPMLEGGEYRSSLFSSGEDDNCTVGYENYKDAALSFLRVFTSRLLIMVCGFLIGHSAVIVFHKLPKDLKFPYT
uniref:Transmembrane protein 188 n=1 Tax=Angiostrongylus cantonensis TaxID=6313 RepID=A0A0K0DL85_ANGCA